MEETNLTKMSDKKLKKKKIINAVIIGFLAGIFFVGIFAVIYKKNFLGIIPMLIPLFLIYKIVKKDKKTE
jgi:uncharacterized membrane protein